MEIQGKIKNFFYEARRSFKSQQNFEDALLQLFISSFFPSIFVEHQHFFVLLFEVFPPSTDNFCHG